MCKLKEMELITLEGECFKEVMAEAVEALGVLILGKAEVVDNKDLIQVLKEVMGIKVNHRKVIINYSHRKQKDKVILMFKISNNHDLNTMEKIRNVESSNHKIKEYLLLIRMKI